MKLSKALKLKNKLAGEVKSKQSLVEEENVQINDNESPFSTPDLDAESVEVQNKLIDIKVKIAIANVPVYPIIYKLAELKNRVAYLKDLNTKEGTFFESRFLSADSARETKYVPQISKERVKELIKEAEEKIEQLQDALDDFNSVTVI
jgi:hypothetical protein